MMSLISWKEISRYISISLWLKMISIIGFGQKVYLGFFPYDGMENQNRFLGQSNIFLPIFSYSSGVEYLWDFTQYFRRRWFQNCIAPASPQQSVLGQEYVELCVPQTHLQIVWLSWSVLWSSTLRDTSSRKPESWNHWTRLLKAALAYFCSHLDSRG